MRKKVISHIICASLLLTACNGLPDDIVLRELYRITTTNGDGIARFTSSMGKYFSGVYYEDNGTLYAESYNIKLKQKRSGLYLYCLDGRKIPVLGYEKYKSPIYEDYPETWEYRDSVYAVKEIHNIRYASALGYWASYPDTTGDSNLGIFMSRMPDVYKRKQTLDLLMDVYLPEDEGTATRPLLVFIHGGAFFNGDKSSLGFPEWSRYFAGLGYVVASVNYRLGFHLNTLSVERAGFRAVQDVNAAIVRIIHEKAKYGVDPERVFVAGTSAGGITALNVAFMRNENIPASARNEGDVMAINRGIVEPFSIRAVGNMWGAVENTNILRNSDVAVISIHSQGDHVVPFGEGHPFEDVYGNSFFFPTTYGSGIITDFLGEKRTRLISYDLPHQHTLQIDVDESGKEYLNPRFWEIEYALRDFFSEHMLPHPAIIQHSGTSQRFFVDETDIETICWKIDGGIFLRQTGSHADVLLFSDMKKHRITVSGSYKSGLCFHHAIEVE